MVAKTHTVLKSITGLFPDAKRFGTCCMYSTHYQMFSADIFMISSAFSTPRISNCPCCRCWHRRATEWRRAIRSWCWRQ